MANPKLRLWAKMIVKGHDEYDNPPAISLITGSPAPTKTKSNADNALTNAAS